MKVLHVITGLNQGGAESALFRLVTYKNIHCEHVIVSMTDMGIYGSKLQDAGIEVYSLDMPRRKLKIKGCFKLFKIIKTISPDVVQTWMYHSDLIGGIIARIAGVKKIFWGVVNFNLHRSITPLSTIITAKLCALVSSFIPYKIISCSEKAIDVHRSFGYRGKFIYIPLGYEMDIYSPDLNARNRIRQEWNISENTLTIGCVARWDPQKDHKNLIKAFSILYKNYPNKINLKCVLIGPQMDQDNNELQALINNIAIEPKSILTVGRANDIPSVMNAIDIHVLSSLGEAFPNVVAEAMACGTPCIVTNVGDASTIVSDTGWIVEPGNSTNLSQVMFSAIVEFKNVENWRVRKVKCREWVLNNFSLEKMVLRYNNVWNDL
jgi:glycosyltransferase involved in cell wall biosynthesis